MTHKTLIKISLLLVLMLTGPLSAAYAQKGAAMKGMVRDEFGKPLVGVAIRSANGNNRSVTQKDGSYSIDVNDGSDRVVFSYLGYADQSVPYQKGADVDVKMLADGHYGDQTIHMGYTDQKLKDVSGAVSVVTGDELRKSPVARQWGCRRRSPAGPGPAWPGSFPAHRRIFRSCCGPCCRS